MTTELWHRVTARFSVGFAWGLQVKREGFVGLGITHYWTPRRRHHKIYIHILFLRVILAWHRRKAVAKVESIQPESD